MERYAILSNDGNTIINIIIASHDYAKNLNAICCNDLEIGIGWVKNKKGNFCNPYPIEEIITIDSHEEITLSDSAIQELLALLRKDDVES